MVRLTLDRGERCVHNSRCEDEGKGREGHKDHTNLSSFFRHPAFGLCRFAFPLMQKREEENLELISHQLRENKKTSHC